MASPVRGCVGSRRRLVALHDGAGRGIIVVMKTGPKTKSPVSAHYTIGRHGFAKISAVEGIRITSEMAEDLREFDRKGLSGDERRRAISRKYGKAGKI